MNKRLLLIFALVHLVLFGVFAFVAYRFYFASGELEHYFADKVLSGQMPYYNFTSEYPPLAFLSFVIPAFFAHTKLSYIIGFAAEFYVFDLIILLVVMLTASRLELNVKSALVFYTIAVIAAGPLIATRYDLFPAMLTAVAVYAVIAGKNKTAWVFLALGVAAKLYPAILAPVFGLVYLRRHEYRKLTIGIIAFFFTLVVISLPWLILDPETLAVVVTYHSARGLHSESTYGTLVLLMQILGLTHAEASLNFGSWNLSSPLADRLADIAPAITILMFGIVYFLQYRTLWKKPVVDNRDIIIYSSLAVFAFLLGNKVFSPQYLIWLCPLLPLLKWQGALYMAAFVAVGGVSQYIYPYFYMDFETAKPLAVFLMFFRNVLVGVMAFWLALCTFPAKSARAASGYLKNQSP